MRNVVDPNRPEQDAQDVPLAPEVPSANGENAQMSGLNPHDAQHQQGSRPAGRCPFHAMLEGMLDVWPDF